MDPNNIYLATCLIYSSILPIIGDLFSFSYRLNKGHKDEESSSMMEEVGTEDATNMTKVVTEQMAQAKIEDQLHEAQSELPGYTDLCL